MNDCNRQADRAGLSGAQGEVVELTGTVCSGLGEGSVFTQIDWVLAQFIDKLGLHPYPGTFNLTIKDERWRQLLPRLRAGGGIHITPPAGFCSADCFPVRIAGEAQGFLVLPQVPDYPADKFEIVAAVALRQLLKLKEGDRVTVQLRLP